ncbi:ATP-grasp domain-containing protein [Trueperella sp. LYQ143]|uniref:carboxylate--amine ligase n=1 Tax=unclassified Trueperella TaxID=2630174 RepID=UPI0039832A4F
MDVPPIVPVVFGADLAEYSVARLFHETYGIKTLVLTDWMRGNINHSRILDVRMLPSGSLTDPARLVPIMKDIADEHSGKHLLMLGNLDEALRIGTTHRAELEPQWFIPAPPAEVIDAANDKSQFAHYVEQAGCHYPASIHIQLSDRSSWDNVRHLRAPYVVKPANGPDYLRLRTCGVEKVAPFATWEDLYAYLDHIAPTGINMIVQELIPGDDTTQWVVNGYIRRDGQLAAVGSGQVLLGLHDPTQLGNAGLILVCDHPELVRQGLAIVERIGLTGFFSLDVKIDPRDGTVYWLDLNPRMGRGSYYLNVGGVNVAQAVTDDALSRPCGSIQRLQREGIFAVLPRFLASRRYIRDPELRRRIRAARANTVNPLDYWPDFHPQRLFFRAASTINHLRRTRHYYPHPTDSGF